MAKLAVQELDSPDGSVQDAPCPRTTSAVSAVRIPIATLMADGARTISSSSITSVRPATGCSIAGPAKPGSPSSKGRRYLTPGCRTTRPWRSWSTSPRGAASVRPPGRLASIKIRSRGWRCWPASTPRTATTSWWLFPPETRELQFDEEWAFVAKKQRNRDPDDPDDANCGDAWDFVAYDPEHRLVVAVIPGARTAENAEAIVAEAKRRPGGQAPDLITSDELPAYKTAIEATFSEPVPAPQRRGPGRPRVLPERRLPEGLNYATVHKNREDNRVVSVEQRQIFGSPEGLEEALGRSAVSGRVNTSFLERQNGADRGRNARKARKTYRFSKDWEVHEAMTYLTMYGSNYCWAVRTLRIKDAEGKWQERTPAMSAGLAHHVWTWREWFARPAAQSA
jgi:IS1 family transposase